MTSETTTTDQGLPDIEPYRIHIDNEVLTDLRHRLARTRWPEPAPDPSDRAGAHGGGGTSDAPSDWAYGIPLAEVQRLATYWRTGYDWRSWEARLNAFPQFVTEIDGERIHFLHVRSPHPDALPLLLTHGWPGSIVEFLDVIGPLTNPQAHGGQASDAFHVVVPSIPGYGFSGPTRTPGVDSRRVARMLAALMARLGYDRYGAQGGDWGAVITRWLAVDDAEHLAGIHLNMVLCEVPRTDDGGVSLDGVTPAELALMADMGRVGAEETGYFAIQSTRPQTLAYAQADSPVGLMAWIVEKFHAWSDDGTRFGDDALLTNVMLYWATGTANSSARLYFESQHAGTHATHPFPHRITVPTGAAIFPKELFTPPRAWAERAYDIVRWTVHDHGGHFAAFERPDELTADVRTFFATLR